MATYQYSRGTPRLHITTSYVDVERDKHVNTMSYTVTRMVNDAGGRKYEMTGFDHANFTEPFPPNCLMPLNAIRTVIYSAYMINGLRGGGRATRIQMHLSREGATTPMATMVHTHHNEAERARVGEMLDSYFALWEEM